MVINSIGSGTAPPLGTPGRTGKAPDPQTQAALADAQADLLAAVFRVNRPDVVVARVFDGVGIDLYL